jgi:N,N-dimethylformamidase
MEIVGYADAFTVAPGERLALHVDGPDGEPYCAGLVRLIHGDVSPEGPGFKSEKIASALDDVALTARKQPVHAGSYGIVPGFGSVMHGAGSFSVSALLWATAPGGRRQAIVSSWSDDADRTCGFSVSIAAEGDVSFRVADGRGGVSMARTLLAVEPKVWYLVAGVFDADAGEVRVLQRRIVTPFNGGNGSSVATPGMPSYAVATSGDAVRPTIDPSWPLMFAASMAAPRAGRRVRAEGIYRELPQAFELPVPAEHFDGKVEAPRVVQHAHSVSELEQLTPASPGPVLAAWDFAAAIGSGGAPSPQLSDRGDGGHDGWLINMPNRAVTGHAWSGDTVAYVHAPDEYAAVHFHEDDLDDCRWDVDFTFDVPADTRSGVYAVRLETSAGEYDHVPFAVRPPRNRATARIALVLPIATYMAYANFVGPLDYPLAQTSSTKVPVLEPEDLYFSTHRELGLSVYDVHSDGSGSAISSRRRPILSMRPEYRYWLTPTWNFNSDLYITDWLEHEGYEYDVLSDEDVHSEGAALLSRYDVVLTGTHPEYTSLEMLDAYTAYQEAGGRFMYLGGNGFYWVTCFHPDDPAIIEVRKGEAATRAWDSGPGELHNAFDGRRGGLWRHRGRNSTKLTGLSFAGFTFDTATYYRRLPDSYSEPCSWIFEGVSAEAFGDYGMLGGGAAGLELDRSDVALGTPRHAYVLAYSEGHTDQTMPVNEDVLNIARGILGGDQNPLVRADVVFYPLEGGGAVFSTGSISWCGALSHADYDNDVARITRNVLDAFLAKAEL